MCGWCAPAAPGELEPVFNAMLENATRICEATFGNLFLREGPIFRSVAVHSPQGHVDSWRRNPVFDLRDNPGIPLDRIAKTKQVVHIPDLQIDQSYLKKNDRIVTLVEVAGARTHVSVPMLKEGELVGAGAAGAARLDGARGAARLLERPGEAARSGRDDQVAHRVDKDIHPPV